MSKKDTKKPDAKQEMALTKVDPPPLEATPMKWWKDENGKVRTELRKNGDIDGLLYAVGGVRDTELAASIIDGTANALAPFFKDVDALNLITQSLHDIQPKDVIESRLAAQATAMFTYAMRFMQRCGNADMVCHMESMANIAVKLSRVHLETIEALSRYRRGGEQKVIVQHNVVAGQAVVNHFQGGGGESKNQGGTPCTESAAPKPEPTEVSHVVGPQWPTDVAGCTAAKAPVRKRKPAKRE